MTITWEQILAFLCEDQSMAVTSLLFIAFFVAVALVHYLLPRVLRPYFLLAASYGFFCYDPVNRPLVGVLLGATAVSWLCGLIIGKVKVKPVRVLALLVTVLGGHMGTLGCCVIHVRMAPAHTRARGHACIDQNRAWPRYRTQGGKYDERRRAAPDRAVVFPGRPGIAGNQTKDP